MTIPGYKSMTDWDRVRKSIEMDEPIPYDANDPDDGPYDPNDDAAVDRFLAESNRIHPAPTEKDRKVAKAS